MEGFKHSFLLFLVIAMIFWESAESCQCSGAGDPCRKTYQGKRFCYIANQNACHDAQESKRISGIFYSYSACEKEVQYHPYIGGK